MFRGLEIARNFCIGGLSAIPPDDKATDYDRGMRAAFKMVQEFIEREQERIIKEAMDADDRFIDSFNAPDVVGRR
jgi:hypothetical protein